MGFSVKGVCELSLFEMPEASKGMLKAPHRDSPRCLWLIAHSVCTVAQLELGGPKF